MASARIPCSSSKDDDTGWFPPHLAPKVFCEHPAANCLVRLHCCSAGVTASWPAHLPGGHKSLGCGASQMIQMITLTNGSFFPFYEGPSNFHRLPYALLKSSSFSNPPRANPFPSLTILTLSASLLLPSAKMTRAPLGGRVPSSLLLRQRLNMPHRSPPRFSSRLSTGPSRPPNPSKNHFQRSL